MALFSDKLQYQDFTLTEALNSIQSLKDYINKARISGGTMLDASVATQIDDLHKLCNNDDCNVNMFIFTDGEDNQSSDKDK